MPRTTTPWAIPRPLLDELRERFPRLAVVEQPVQDGGTVLWVAPTQLRELLIYLKEEARPPFPMLFDLSAVDERARRSRPVQLPSLDPTCGTGGQPAAPRPPAAGTDRHPDCEFSLLYQLLSPERNEEVRLRVPLQGEYPTHPSITSLWPAAGWYEREIWDMFGIRFEGHPFLRRLLMPDYWEGHPLRKEHPCRGTELAPYRPGATPRQAEAEKLVFRPEDWDLLPDEEGVDTMHLSLGPQHPGTHGLIRFVLQLEGERIRDLGTQIGFHHRGQEKLAERQTYHTYIPYTDRIDYLAGVQNELPYVLAVEQLAGIEVPPRAKTIRVLLAELFRISSHLVYLGTFGQDLGAQSPLFYAFNERERVLHLVESFCGFRMHPGFLRIGGVADDLPQDWRLPLYELVRTLPPRLTEMRRMLLDNSIFRRRTRGIGVMTREEALAWGITGPNLRATGLAWDLRRARPYSGYENYDFEIPVAEAGDCHARGLLRLEEMHESLRIIAQAADGMPEGPVKSDHPLASPPDKPGGTMVAIETLIQHFLAVSWGKPLPVGEAQVITEAPKGNMGFWVMSDGDVHSYRTRIRTPTFPLMQTVRWLARGLMVPDIIAILGSIDYVMGDVDR